jgi:hypothetical protein
VGLKKATKRVSHAYTPPPRPSRLGFGRERRGFFPLRVEFGHLGAAPGVLQGAALDAVCGDGCKHG